MSLRWTGPTRHPSFRGHRIWRAWLGEIVVAVVELTSPEDRYDLSFTLPIGRPADWSDCGRENNIGGRDFKTLVPAQKNAERNVMLWIKRASLTSATGSGAADA